MFAPTLIPLRLHLLLLALLTGIGLLGKLFFALHHEPLHAGLSSGELLLTLLWGIRFDLALAAPLSLLATLGAWLIFRLRRGGYAGALRWCAYPLIAALVLLQGADLLYFDEAGRHMGYELKEGINSGGALAASALETYLGTVLWALVLMLPLWLIAWRLLRAQSDPRGWQVEWQLPLILVLSVILTRGGLQSVPLEPLHAQQIGEPHHASLALNGAYNALFSSVTPYSVNPLFAEAPGAEERLQVSSLYAEAAVLPEANGLDDANIVLLFLESWSGAYMQSYGYELPTTPIFDQLRRQGLSARGLLAGGHRTTEGMFATLCSAQNPLGQTVAQSQLQSYSYRCLPHVLRERGRSSAFFQSTLKNTSGTGAFAQLLGFEESYGIEEMPAPTMGLNSWGQHDPDLYRFALQHMRAMPQPFLVGINTNSTHDALLPDSASRPFSGHGGIDDYLNTLHFADAALGDFIQALHADPALANTIVVLVADHAGRTPPGGYQSYLVPFAILAPGLEPRELESVLSQRDIAPTLLQLMGLPVPPQFSGRAGGSGFADYYHHGWLGWVEDERLLEVPLQGANGLRCFDLARDPAQQRPLACSDVDEAMAQRARAFSHLSQWRLFAGELDGREPFPGR